jgi:hypothetical protein
MSRRVILVRLSRYLLLVRQGQVPRLLSVLGGDSMLGVPIKAELAQRRRLIYTVQQ